MERNLHFLIDCAIYASNVTYANETSVNKVFFLFKKFDIIMSLSHNYPKYCVYGAAKNQQGCFFRMFI